MRRLDKAFNSFYRRCKSSAVPGYPRFKAIDRFNAFTYVANDGAKIVDGRLRLQHIGKIRIKMHRSIEGTPKIITIKRECDNWYAIVVCELPDVEVFESDRPSTGIDVGLTNFLTTMDGYQEPALRPLKPLLPQLRVEQRTLARRKRGSKGRQKAKIKAASAGVGIYEVNARYTSQACSECGQIAPKKLSERWHTCDCGYSAHRDQNAARNIYLRGLLAGMRPGSLNVTDVGLHDFRSA